MGDIEGIFLNILIVKTKPIFVGINYRPPYNINFLECFRKYLGDINFNNEIFLLGDINLLHNAKYILEENQAMQIRIPSKNLVNQYSYFVKDFLLNR